MSLTIGVVTLRALCQEWKEVGAINYNYYCLYSFYSFYGCYKKNERRHHC